MAETDAPVQDAPPQSNWEPPRLSRGLVACLTLTIGLALVGVAGFLRTAVIGLVGGLCLAGALWLTAQERYATVAVTAASVLYLPAGLCLVGAVVVTLIDQYGAAAPLPDSPAMTLRIWATVGLVSGATVGVFGAGAQGRALDRTTVQEAVGVTARLAVVPLTLAIGLGVGTVLSSPAIPPTVDLFRLIGAGVATLGRALLSPPTPLAATDDVGRLLGEVALATFVLLCVAAVLGVRTILRVLPIAELAADYTNGLQARLSRFDRLLARIGFVGVILIPIALVDVVLTTTQLQTFLAPSTISFLYLFVTNRAIRILALGIAVIALGTWMAVALLRRAAQRGAAALTGYVPLVTGGGVVVCAFAIGPTVIPTGIAAIASRLGSFSEQFTSLATGVTEFYGAGLVLTGCVATALVVTWGFVVTLQLCNRFGLLAPATTGSTLAGVGLVIAAGFGAVLALPVPLVVLGTGVGLIVADLGRHARVLGQEIGRRGTTYRVELVRTGTLSVVLLVATALALVVARVAIAGLVTPVPAALPLTVAIGAVGTVVLVLWMS